MKLDRYGKGIAKGLKVTFKNLLRTPVTTQYPEKRLSVSRRTRGNELIWSKERCTGCATCAKSCHEGAIHIKTARDSVANRYEVLDYTLDTGYCIFCGICVESCPFDALYMGYAYERARYSRQDLVQNKEDMMFEKGLKKPSGYFYPEEAEKLPKQTLLIEKILRNGKMS